VLIMATKKDPTTAAELSELSVAQLEKLADKRSVTVTRGDGEEGAPLKDDYVKALAGGAGVGMGAVARRAASAPKFVDAQGNRVNEEGERTDKYGNLLDGE
jgi:hypothetical protein